MSEINRKPNKHEQRKQLQYVERRNRLINQGTPEDKVDLVIAQQDYDALPLDRKVKRLEQMIQGLASGVSRDIMNLMDNDKIMADTYDINVRVIKRLLNKLGLAPEEFNNVVDEVEAEFKAEQEAQEKARKDAEEKDKLEQMLKDNNLGGMTSPILPPEESLHTHTHPEATTFGG